MSDTGHLHWTYSYIFYALFRIRYVLVCRVALCPWRRIRVRNIGCRAFLDTKLSNSNYTRFCPSEKEWNKAKKIKTFLRVFYNVPSILSGKNYPTDNNYFPNVFLEGGDGMLTKW